MTDQLRRRLDDLHALATRTAVARGLPAAYVEKDFWVTEVLRVATDDRVVTMPDGSTAPVTFLFKGGTSLSRVFGIVERFPRTSICWQRSLTVRQPLRGRKYSNR